MKQILQNLANGETSLVDVPAPNLTDGTLLIATRASLVSSGTERMLVEFGKANLIDKARQQPDKVRMVIDKIKTDGLLPTIETVRNKLDQPLPLGYCNVGTVLQIGNGITGFQVGDRVASNGNHAEVVRVPTNLCARVPDNVSDESAAFTVIGAIALQGVRLVKPGLGEMVVVTGLGLIGLMTVQLLKAQGCHVLGIDYDADKIVLARQFGAECVNLSRGEDTLKIAEQFSRGRGVDAVIITAATKSSEPVSQAARMCRKRGRIVLVGVTGLELSRADFFEKELSFQVSCSYGPGRYDPDYEEMGHDYPVGYVRWTEQRNMEAVLDMMSGGQLDVSSLISHRFQFDDALRAYELLAEEQSTLGLLLSYPELKQESSEALLSRSFVLSDNLRPRSQGGETVVGFIGAGSYAGQALIPAFRKGGAILKTIASSGGVSGTHHGKKHGFNTATTDTNHIFSDEAINAVVIATRHNTHARFVLEALRAAKHVFVEKPLCLTRDELSEIQDTYQNLLETNHAPLLMVGFNRRFSPHIQKIKALLGTSPGPSSFMMTINAGEIPADHWTQDPAVGGGRIIGEACHFIDLLRYLADSSVVDYQAAFLGGQHEAASPRDKVTITLRFANGSIGTVHYLANGHKSFPKERLEIFCDGGILQLDNFRKLRGYGWPGFRKMDIRRQDKGQQSCAGAFIKAVREGDVSPIPWEEIVEVSRLSIEIAESQA